MKLVSFQEGSESHYGVVIGDRVHPAPANFLRRCPDLKAAIAAGALPDLAATARNSPDIALSSIRITPVIANPGKILCVGVNYLAHIREMGREPPKYPTLFVRFPDSLVGHGDSLRHPGVSLQYDYEGELAIVVGRKGRHVKREAALAHVAGFTCFMDGSVRDWQAHTSQFIPGKNFPASGAVGPWLVTTDEIPDPRALTLETRINGEVRQSAPISDLCIDVPAIIEYCSTFCELHPGDIIATGTPAGVGHARKPPAYLEPGDVVEVEISGIGILRNAITAA